MKNVIIFIDGASSGNPGPAGWGAILVSQDKVVELGGASNHATNNQMELFAALQALKRIKKEWDRLIFFSDSKYLIRGVTEWLPLWEKRGWTTQQGTEIQNLEIWKELAQELEKKHQTFKKMKIIWSHVSGHAGIPGNERVDEIAVQFSKGKKATLYQGSSKDYPIAISKGVPSIHDQSQTFEVKKTKLKTPIYLSLVDGVLERHPDWNSCNQRVQGRRGAKYKKVSTVEEEALILESWGIS